MLTRWESAARGTAFHLPGVDGKTYSLDSSSATGRLVSRFHLVTHRQAYEGRIQQLPADYKDKKVALVAISPNDPKAAPTGRIGL